MKQYKYVTRYTRCPGNRTRASSRSKEFASIARGSSCNFTDRQPTVNVCRSCDYRQSSGYSRSLTRKEAGVCSGTPRTNACNLTYGNRPCVRTSHGLSTAALFQTKGRGGVPARQTANQPAGQPGQRAAGSWIFVHDERRQRVALSLLTWAACGGDFRGGKNIPTSNCCANGEAQTQFRRRGNRQRARKRPITCRFPFPLLYLSLLSLTLSFSLPLDLFFAASLRTTCGVGCSLAAEQTRVTCLRTSRERGTHATAGQEEGCGVVVQRWVSSVRANGMGVWNSRQSRLYHNCY